MKRRLNLATLGMAALLAWGVGVHAQGVSDEEAVGAAVERLRLAMIDPDRSALDELVADELSYGHSGGRVDTKASFIGDLMSAKSDFVSIELIAQSVRVVGDVALVRHRLRGATLDQGKPGQVDLHVLLVWHRHDGQWRLLARQAVRTPA